MNRTHLNVFTVVEQHIAQLFGHHVQVSLLALVGPGQNVKFGEVGRQIVERPGEESRCGFFLLLLLFIFK